MSELELSDQNFDLSMLIEIADGADEFLVETIELFLKQTPELMYAIDSAIREKQWLTAAQAAHKLKPNLGFFGMLESQTLMQQLEALCKAAEDSPEIKTIFLQLVGKVRPTLTKLEVIMKAKQANL
jgi:HPt (histidine-containing phosphotransfer) domain-containing protein